MAPHLTPRILTKRPWGGTLTGMQRTVHRIRAHHRTWVEHPFQAIKGIFGVPQGALPRAAQEPPTRASLSVPSPTCSWRATSFGPKRQGHLNRTTDAPTSRHLATVQGLSSPVLTGRGQADMPDTL